MKLATRIFKRSDWYVTSGFGWRMCPFHGKEFHNGVDYGTHIEKWKQYALEDGYVFYADKVGNTSYGKYVWVRYPRINRSLLHAHLDSVLVNTNEKVNENTIIGITGMTGSATGIHLHLGMTEIGKTEWLNPDTYDYEPPVEPLPPEPTPSTDIKVGDYVVPIRLVDYNGTPLIQFDNKYKVIELVGDRAVLEARGQVWSAMNVADIRKID